MKFFDSRIVFSTAVLALLTACGGSADSGPAEDHATSAPIVQGENAPVADCEAEGCNRPRIIDGLAEQYRANAVLQPAPAVEPVQAGMLPAQASASEAAPAILAPPQAPALN